MKKFVLLAAVLLVSVTFTYAQFTFTSIDFPGGTLTTARGINNNGEIVGAYRIVPPRHALLIKGGQYIPLAPTTVLGTNYSEAFKNNDRGDAVGDYLDDAGFAHGFLLSKKGVLTQLDFPAASDTYAYGINESGTVVGQWDLLDSNGNVIAQHGFTWGKGSFSQVDYPGSANTTVFGINARGDLVGEWDDNVVAHGFIRTKQGQFTSYDVPVAGATLTELTDINANGQILGVYFDAGGAEHGFLQVGATFTSIDYPGAVTTTAWGINSAGQIVGNHFGSDGIAHGWLAERSNRCLAAPSNMIDWWPGDGNAQDIVSGANGVPMGAGYAKAFVDKGFTFDGIDDYVNVPDAPVLHAITTAVTVDAWINPQLPVPPSGTGYSEGWIFARRDPLISEGVSFRVNSDGYVMIDLQAAEESFLASTAPVIQYNGMWKHISLTADTATGQVNLYLNGQPVQLFSIWGPMGVSGQFAYVTHLFIGQRESEGPQTMHYGGLIDEVHLFNRALTQSEILTIYQAGGNGVCKR